MFLKFNLTVFSPFYLRSTSVLGPLNHFFINLQSVRCTDGRAVRAVPCFSYHSIFFVFMGKQLGIIQFSGKLDNVVGAKKSANQRSNVLRVHRATIANPKSAAQILRRMRLLPATNFYRALQPLLNHAFQGTAYKAPSYSEFMRLALSNDAFPYVTRGESRPIPGPYQISKGSLPSISIRDFGQVGEGPMVSSLKIGDIASTFGEFSSRLIAANPALQNGDQLTIISVYSDDPDLYDANIVYLYAALVLDVTSTKTMASVMSDKGITLSPVGDFLAFEFNNMQADNALAAGAIILSRPSTTPGAAWQRSTTFMQIQPDTLSFIRSQAHFDAAFASYAESKSMNVSSDWYLNQTKSRYQDGSVFLFAASNGTVPQALYFAENGVQYLVVNDNNCIYIFDGITATETSTVAAGDLPTVNISDVKNTFPSLDVKSLPKEYNLAWRQDGPNQWLVDTNSGRALYVSGSSSFYIVRSTENNSVAMSTEQGDSSWGSVDVEGEVSAPNGVFTFEGDTFNVQDGVLTPNITKIYE